MKKIIFGLIVSTLLACNSNTTSNEKTTSTLPKPTTEMEKFDWLLGSWERTNDEEGKTTFEYWEKENWNEYYGLGYTMVEQDTVSKELIRLYKSNDVWNLGVIIGEAKPVLFKLTQMDDNSFICENEANDFPKKIHYFKDGDKLMAAISGGDMKIDFEFEKK